MGKVLELPWLLRDDCTAIFLQITATFPCAHSFTLSLPAGSGPEFIKVPPCLGIVLPSPSPFSPLVLQTIKKSACNAGGLGSIPGSESSPGEGNGTPLQYSCLEDSMDRGAWRTTVHGVTKSWT